VRLVDAVAQDRRRGRELGARVDAVGLARVRRGVRADALARRGEDADRVREVQLALDVVRLEPLERAPELGGAEDVYRGVDLADLPLLGRRVGPFGDADDVAADVADDAAVEPRIDSLKRQ